MFAKLRKVLLVCVIVLLVQVPVVTFAQSGGPGQPPPVVRSDEEAYRADAEAYVAAFGGTIDEAVRRLKLQDKIAKLDAKLQTHESRVFAGLWIEHTPRFRVVVQFTRGGKEVVLPLLQKGPLAPLTNEVEVQNAPISLQQLRKSHNEVIQNIQATGVPFESDIVLQNSSINVYVTSREQLEVAMSNIGRQFPDNVQVVEVEQLSQPQANWYAGYRLNNGNGCTSGFSLRTAFNQKYASTAGHCTGANISPLGTPIVRIDQGTYDFQVNPVPSGYTIKNWAADNIFDSTPYYREITAVVGTASVGTFVCKFGAVTGYQCGNVESNNYSFESVTPWLLIKASNPNAKISCGGDSGGPVYTGSTAVGAHVAGWCSLTNNKSVAMLVNKYWDQGYNVMTAP
ncbi:MAG: S1 family peptidase [Anaerolineales bacterium]